MGFCAQERERDIRVADNSRHEPDGITVRSTEQSVTCSAACGSVVNLMNTSTEARQLCSYESLNLQRCDVHLGAC